MNKIKKAIAGLTVMGMVLTATPVFATVDAYVAKDTAGSYFNYNIDELVTSYVASQTGTAGGELFLDYYQKDVFALHDDLKGYINFQDVLDAYIAHEGETGWTVDGFTEGGTATAATLPATISDVSLVGGTVTNTDMSTGEATGALAVTSVSAINGTATVGDVYTLPTTVTATLVGGTTQDLAVTWDTVAATTVAGTYTFTGTLTMVDGVVNTDNVTVTATLTVAASQAQLDAAAAKTVEDAITALPATVTLTDKVAVEAARTAFTGLTATQQALVTNVATLTAAETVIADLEAAAALEAKAAAITVAVDKISAIGNPAILELDDEATVVDARTAVTAATELGAVDADIVNLAQLVASEATIADLKAALDAKATATQDAKVALVNLPMTVTLDNKVQVETARGLVDAAIALGAVEADFTNLWKLTAAEATIAQLEGVATDAAAAKVVEDAITALPAVDVMTLVDATAVGAARTVFTALTAIQQALVPNVAVLTAAEAQIVVLEAADEELTVDSVNAINGTVTVTLSSAPTVAPVIGDFVVTKGAATVTPTVISTVGAVVTLTVPTIAATATAQSIVYSVAYKTGTAVPALAFTVDAAVVVLAPASAEALNANQIKVTYNKDLTTAQQTAALLKTNYSVYNNGLATAILDADWDAGALSGTNAVILTLTGAGTTKQLSNNVTDSKVVVEKAAFGGAADVTFSNLSVVDVTRPTVASVAVTAANQIKVTFSEPVFANTGVGALTRTLTAAGFEIDNGQIAVAGIATPLAAATQYKVITLNLGGTLTAGDHTIKLNPTGVAAADTIFDGANWVSNQAAVTFTRTADTTAPVATIKSATQTQVVLQFDEPIVNVTDTNVIFYHSVSGQAQYIMAAGAQAADNTVTLTYTTGAPLPAGNIPIFITYTVAASAGGTVIQDNFANKMAAQTLTATVTADAEKPTITSAAYNATSGKIDVTFSEDVTNASAAGANDARNPANYELKQGTTTVAVTGVTYATKVASLTANLTGGDYTLVVKNVKDIALVANTMVDSAALAITVPDSVKPYTVNKDGTTAGANIYTLDAASKVLKVYFSEAMNATDLADVTKYTATVATVAGTNPTTAVAAADGKSVTLTFSAAATSPYVGQMRDLSGNKIATLSTLLTVQAVVAPTITKAWATGLNTIDLYADNVISNAKVTDFQIDPANAAAWEAPASILSSLVDGKTVITLTTTTALAQAAWDGASVPKVRTAGGAAATDAADAYTNKMNIVATTAADKIAPTLTATNIKTVDADANGKIDHIKITFNEKIAAGNVSADKFAVTGYVVTDAFASTAAPTAAVARTSAAIADSTDVYVTVTEGTTPDTSAKPTVTIATGLKDVATNAYAGLSTATASVDNAAPVLVSAVLANVGATANVLEVNDTIALTFSEAMDTTKITTLALGAANSGTLTSSIGTVFTFATKATTDGVGTGTVAWSNGNKTVTLTITAVSVVGSTSIGGNLALGTAGVTSATAEALVLTTTTASSGNW